MLNMESESFNLTVSHSLHSLWYVSCTAALRP
jgi:hypothetical protein